MIALWYSHNHSGISFSISKMITVNNNTAHQSPITAYCLCCWTCTNIIKKQPLPQGTYMTLLHKRGQKSTIQRQILQTASGSVCSNFGLPVLRHHEPQCDREQWIFSAALKNRYGGLQADQPISKGKKNSNCFLKIALTTV